MGGWRQACGGLPSDSFKRSILLDAQADLISYGMGERSIVEIADALNSGISVKDITFIPGTVYKTRDISGISGGNESYHAILTPSYDEMKANPAKYAESFGIQYQNTDPFTARILAESYPKGLFVVQNPPQKPLSTEEMDDIYSLPYQRAWHPSYDKAGGVPALAEVKFSLVSARGCFGGCNFCSLAFHQGRMITSRSHESVVREVEIFTRDPKFKGYVHDVGGPSANFRHPSCKSQLKNGMCKNRSCLAPTPCKNLDPSHADYLALLRKVRAVPGVKKVFIRSGIRYDYMLSEKNGEFFSQLVKHHVSGQLKVAPEHCSARVLDYMGKPHFDVYERFRDKYQRLNQRYGLEQYLVPYLMSSHPGCTLNDAVDLAVFLNRTGRQPEQVQDFYPTPGTLATCMWYTGIDPRTMKPVFVPKTPHDKALQRALMQWRKPQNRKLVLEALHKTGREDLIGFDRKCLIRPRKDAHRNAEHRNAEHRNTNHQNAAKTFSDGRRGDLKSGKKKTIRNVHRKKGKG